MESIEVLKGVVAILKKGFSYIEVLIAGALLSILMLPVTSSLYQAMSSLQYSVLHYQATLLAKNLVLDAEQAWINKVDLNNIFAHSNFSKNYDPLLDYAIAIYRPENESFQISEIFTKGAAGDLQYRSPQTINATRFLEQSYNGDMLIYYDGIFRNVEGSIGNLSGDTCQISYDGNEDITVDIVFEQIRDSVEIIVNNFGEGYLYINISTPNSIPVQISFDDGNKNSFISYYEYKFPNEIIIAAEVYNTNGRLLSRIIKPIYYKSW